MDKSGMSQEQIVNNKNNYNSEPQIPKYLQGSRPRRTQSEMPVHTVPEVGHRLTKMSNKSVCTQDP